MKKYLKDKWKRIVASILVTTMFFTSVSIESLALEPKTTEKKVTTEKEQDSYTVDKQDVIESKNTENSTTYDAGNGVLVTEFYGQPVRFRDKEGELVDYDASLVAVKEKKSKKGNNLKTYAFENKVGDKKHYFPEKLTEETPLLLENDKYQIKFLPIEKNERARANQVSEVAADEVDLQEEKVTDIYEEENTIPIKTVYGSNDGKISYQYSSLENGIKEEIVLAEKPKSNTFSFLLEIPGLTIRKSAISEGLTIYDGDTIVAGIQAPNMNDATGEAYSEDLQYSLETIDEAAGKYCLTLTVNEEYLSAEERQYPVTVDPTLTWSDNSKISDVYALSKYPTLNYYSADITSFYIGYGTQGASRAFLSFASLSAISKKHVKKASFQLTECTNSQAGKTVQAFRITGAWSGSSVRWNNQPKYNATAVGSITTKGPSKANTMDLTKLVQGYADGTYSNYGIMLKNTNESSNSYFTKFYGARHASAGYRPKLTVEYYDRPAKAVSVKMTPKYVKPKQSAKVEWSGITSGELSYIQYRTAEFDEKANKEIKADIAYSANTKIGKTANGSADITVGSSVPAGTFKTYKVAVRGVGASGAVGQENAAYLNVDNAPPTGNIKVLASGTGEKTDVLRDTVEIVGEVNGTGSPIKSSSMKLYDSTGKFVQDIYTNSTLSKVQCVYTPELPNGTYTLKLLMEDSVGFTAEKKKTIKVVNRLASPVVRPVLTNQGNVEIEWEFPYAATDVQGIAYKLPGSDTWNNIAAAGKTSGKFTVSLPNKEGVYDVSVCGIDKEGYRGETAIAKCAIDKTNPTAVITEAGRGIVYGTIADKNLSEWSITLKKSGSTTEETILQGKRQIENSYIGLFDMSNIEIGAVYELCLTVYDKAGNQTKTVQNLVRKEGDIVVTMENPDFVVKRPAYTTHTANHIVFPANIKEMQLTKWLTAESMPVGNTKWYCDGKLVSSESTWNKNLPTSASGKHTILAVIEKDGKVYYSRNKILNKELIDVNPNQGIALPENSVSVCLHTKEAGTKAKITVDGIKVAEIVSGQPFHFASLNAGEKATASMVQITPLDTGADTTEWKLAVDCIDEETFELSEAENYHPYDVGIKDKLNYKTYVKWEGVQGEWPQQVSYEIYRGQEPGFVPSEENRIAADIKANYWAEMNVNYSRNFYYRIRAVEKDAAGKIIRASSFSDEVSSTVIDADEYVKRMGLKEYWEYAEFDTPSGNGSIEKSKGNLVYTQADTEIPNEQLPVVLERTYNSQSSEKTAFGVGWTHSFDMELLNICKNDSLEFKNIVLKDGNGTLYFYTQKEDGSYTSSMGKYTTLKKEAKTEEVELPEKEVGVKDKTKKVKVVSEFTMETKDNIEYRFNSGGQLIYMSEANGNFLLFEYEPNKGLLSKVRTSKNLTMEFVYFSERDVKERTMPTDVLTVKEIRLPDGSKVAYDYQDARLSSVTKIGTDKSSSQHWSLAYNDKKQVTEISDACGNIYKIGYQKEKANKITYPSGEAILLEYDGANNKTTAYKEVTENGKTEKILPETNTFEPSSGNSIQMVDSEGNSVKYEYMDNLLTKTIYSMTYRELEGNRVVEKTTEKAETKKYSSRENVTEEVDEDGMKTTYTYDAKAPEHLADYPVGRQLVNAEGYLISDETYKYDSFGNVIRSYDSVDGRVVETTYYETDDPATGKIKGEIKSEREYFLEDSGNQSSTESTYTYDAAGKKTVVTTEKSGQYTVKTTTVYDVMGREISSTDTMGLTTTTVYDPFGRVSKVTVKQGDITDVVTREYDDNGTLIKEVEEDGTVYTYTYDNMNRIVKEGIQKDDLSKTWTTDYSYGSVQINTGKGKETVNHVMITTEKNPDNEVLESTYVDTFGRTVREKKNGLYTDYAYDREGHVIAACQLGIDTDNTKPLITAYLYDKDGNASGQILNPGYDAGTKAFTVTNDSLTQSMTYDSMGNVLSATDGEGNTTTYTYDANGRITSVTEPENGQAGKTTYEYDKFPAAKNGNTQNIVTDALGRKSVTTYNMAMQPVSVEDLGDGTVKALSQKYTYDSKGRTSEEKGSLGTARTYEYDGKDRVTTVHYKNASGAEELRTCYTYDKADNITTMLDYNVSGTTASLYRYTAFKYDRLKRLVAQTELNTNKAVSAITAEEKEANTTKYSYDIDGNLLSVTYPQSDWEVASLKYTYNSNKWLQSVIAVLKDGKEAVLRSYTYDKYGAVSEITDYRAITEDGKKVENPQYTVCKYTYDVCRRPKTMTYTDSSNPELVKEAYSYTYDKNSRLVEETLQNFYPDKEQDQQNEIRRYTYDVRSNLTKTDVQDLLNAANSFVMSYTYDAVGNRVKQGKEAGGVTETTLFAYNSLNQLLTSETKRADGTATERKMYQYDADGNQIKESDAVSGKETLNTYDSAGRLAACTKKESGKTTLQQTNKYNGSGARIQKAENGTVTNYFYSQGNVLYTKDGTGKETSLNLHGIAGNIIATARNNGKTEKYYYYHKDPKGSTTNLRDVDGKSVVSYQYTDFGETSIHGDTDFYNEICYNEAIYDKSTGLYYLNARYYNPEDGRFITRDSYRGSAMNPSTQHLYVYCANNPINNEDPSGHIAISRIVGGIVGGVAGALVGKTIAKKTKAKGWKKAAIIVGCTVAGGAFGALLGPKVTKVTKKAKVFVKKKLPSKITNLRLKKVVTKKDNPVAKKGITNTKKVISKAKAKKAVKRGATGAIRGMTTGSIQTGLTGNKVTKKSLAKSAMSGAISSVTGVLAEGKKSATPIVGVSEGVKGYIDAYSSSRSEGKGRIRSFLYGGIIGIEQGLLGAMDSYFGNVLPEEKDWINIAARGIQRGTSDVFGVAVGTSTDLIASKYLQ